MSEKELLDKIQQLQAQLLVYQKKEQYINEGVVKTKEVYEIARHNAEKIIARSVLLAYEIKEKTLDFLNELNEEISISKIQELLDKYQSIFDINKQEIQKITKKLVDKVKK